MREREREWEREGERGKRSTRVRERKRGVVPANKKRAAMHSLYSLDINTRQRARNQPRLHRQLLPNDTDTHTQPLIVIKQKNETEAARERERKKEENGEREEEETKEGMRVRKRGRERGRKSVGRRRKERGAQAAVRRCCEFVHAPIRALRVVDECGRLSESLSLPFSLSFTLFLEDAAKYCIVG